MAMKRLTQQQTAALISEMEQAAIGNNWAAWHEANVGKPARIEFPMGELTNPDIAGFVCAWNMQGLVRIVSIEKGDGFVAQGMESKVTVETGLTTALLAYRELPEYRRLLWV